MILSWLQSLFMKNITQSILWIDKSHTIWKNVEGHFSQGDIFKISDLQDDLTHHHQGNINISTYSTQLTSLWEQINSSGPTRYYTCAILCTCGANFYLRKYKDRYRIIKFLKGLTEKFCIVRSQIFFLDPLTSMDMTFSTVRDQECRSTPSNLLFGSLENHLVDMKLQPTTNC